jgi:hypothetical protein
MSKTYMLVNPYVTGKMTNRFEAKTPLLAAKKAYKALSKHFSNNVPIFHFSLQKTSGTQVGGGSNGDYFHFQVKEKKDSTGHVSYSLESYKVNNVKGIKNFRKNIKTFTANVNKAQTGGASKIEDDLSWLDDEEDEIYKSTYSYVNIPEPITYWYYDPYVYRLKRFFIPTFVYPLRPYILVNVI